MPRVIQAALVTLIATVLAVTAAAETQLEVSMPGDVRGREVSDVSITLRSDTQLTSARLTLKPSSGFAVKPDTLDIPPFQGKLYLETQLINVSPVRDGDYRLTSRLAISSAQGPVLNSDERKFSYHGIMSLLEYLPIGIIGIAIGYALRILIKVLSGIKPPDPAPALAEAGPPPEGPITRFTRRHYYLVDFSVTLVLGFLVLAATLRQGHPPDASTWHSALLAGVALGLLTNSDLVTRLR